MNEKTEGLVLKELDYRENSIILTVLSREYGRLSFIVQGARRMTSKNRAGTLPYTRNEYQFDYKEGRNIFRLKTAVSLELFRWVHEDLNASCAAAVLAELLDAFANDDADRDTAEFQYELYLEALKMLNEKRPADLVLAVSVSQLMKKEGIAPYVDGCVLCGSSQVSAVSVSEGGFLCPKCVLKSSGRQLPSDSLQRFRLVSKAEQRHMPLLADRMDTCLQELSILIEMIRLHTGLPVRSYNLFQRLFRQ
jgi:DNA repair protein RecO (recombination protein O)